MKLTIAASALLLAGLISTDAQAADWSDTSLNYRYGSKFAEPFNNQNISKHILGLTDVRGFHSGVSYMNLDLLLSNSKDPRSLGSSDGATEAYLVYRYTFDLAKLLNKTIRFGAIKSMGPTLGFDLNSRNDVAYNSRKQMIVTGPTLSWDVPAGHLNTSLLILRESNAPSGPFPPISNVKGRYTYKTHPMLAVNWSLPVGSLPLAFEGYANFIGSKGKDEVGNQTGAETDIDMQLMWDVGRSMGGAKNTFRLGVEYQYWKNKFGNTSATAGRGSFAKTPMIRGEYHF